MSHKSKGRKNLRNQETYPVPMDEPREVSLEAVEYADTYFLTPAQERLWIGSGDSAHE